MGSRVALDTILKEIPGVSAVYFQPPTSLNMSYPCIVYERTDIDSRHAANKPYSLNPVYTVKVIYTDPDSSIPFSVAALRGCAFDRRYIVNNLYHDVFSIQF